MVWFIDVSLWRRSYANVSPVWHHRPRNIKRTIFGGWLNKFFFKLWNSQDILNVQKPLICQKSNSHVMTPLKPPLKTSKAMQQQEFQIWLILSGFPRVEYVVSVRCYSCIMSQSRVFLLDVLVSQIHMRMQHYCINGQIACFLLHFLFNIPLRFWWL